MYFGKTKKYDTLMHNAQKQKPNKKQNLLPTKR